MRKRRSCSVIALVCAFPLLLSTGARAQALSLAQEGYSLISSVAASPVAVSVPLAVPYRAVAYGATVQVLDMSNPDAPVVTSQLGFPQPVLALEARGSYLYVADGNSGFIIVNVGNPYNMVKVGSVRTTHAQAIALNAGGTHAYVCNGDSSFTVVNVKDPARPKVPQLSLGSLKANFRDAVVSEKKLIVAAGGRGVEIYSLQYPGRPVKVARYKALTAARALAVQGRLLAVADDEAGLVLLSLASWSSPTLKGTFAVAGQALDCAFMDGDPTKVVVAEGTAGYQIVDVSDPSAPISVAQSASPSPVTSVSAEDPTVYLSCGVSGLWRLDLADPAQPVPHQVLTGAQQWGPVTTNGAMAYVGSGSEIQAWDYTDPYHPIMKGTVTAPAVPLNLLVSGSLLLASCQQAGVAIYDITQPASPSLLSTYAGQGSATQASVSGDLLALADGQDGVLLLDITNPASPVLIGSWNYTVKANGFVAGVAFASPTLLWVSQSVAGLVSLDVTNPSAPVELGKLSTNFPGDLVLYQNYAYVAMQTTGLARVDISDPAKPATAGDAVLVGNAVDLHIAGDRLLVADGQYGLREYDLTDPITPNQVALFGGPGFTFSAAALPDGTRLVTTRDGGIWALSAAASCASDQLVLPCDAEALPGLYPPLFSWKAVSPYKYKVKVSVDPDFPDNTKKTLVAASSGSAFHETYWSPNANQMNWLTKRAAKYSTLYWRVAYFKGSNLVSHSETRTFTLK